MDKQVIQDQFNSFLKDYTLVAGNPIYSKDDLLNFYLQGRIDANNDILKKLKP